VSERPPTPGAVRAASLLQLLAARSVRLYRVSPLSACTWAPRVSFTCPRAADHCESGASTIPLVSLRTAK
jgi:hypothetical protein